MRIIICFFFVIAPLAVLCQAVMPDFQNIRQGSSKSEPVMIIKVSKDKNNVVHRDTTKQKTNRTKDILDKRIVFYGLTALNNGNNDIENSITATGRMGVLFAPSRTGGFKINLGANLLNAKPSTGQKKDSVDFNSLMFPESGNFGFLFNPSCRLSKWRGLDSSNHSLALEGTFTYRRVGIDSPAINFKVLTYNLGLKYQWDYRLGGGEYFVFTGIFYGNLFNIPDEDVNKFNLFLNDPIFSKVNKNAEIWSLGVKVTAQYRNFIFFADIRNNLRTKELSDDNPLKGTKFNIGFATLVTIKSF